MTPSDRGARRRTPANQRAAAAAPPQQVRKAPQSIRSGNNGSAFFFRLPSRAKSAMAEILVSNLCELSPALLGGLFSLGRGRPHATTSEDLNRSQPDASTRPDFPLVSIVLRIVFSIVFHCCCASGFSVAVARACIVIGAHFPLQIDCILQNNGGLPIGGVSGRPRDSYARHVGLGRT
jgi:hypothetical protein